MKKLLEQILAFGVVGIAATFIDYFLMILCTEVFHIFYLLSSTISFLVSLVFNYIFSMKFVFHGRDDLSRKKEFLIFFILSILGLLINQAVLWIMVEFFHLFYAIGKIFATAVVMIWNFITRKLFLEKKDGSF